MNIKNHLVVDNYCESKNPPFITYCSCIPKTCSYLFSCIFEVILICHLCDWRSMVHFVFGVSNFVYIFHINNAIQIFNFIVFITSLSVVFNCLTTLLFNSPSDICGISCGGNTTTIFSILREVEGIDLQVHYQTWPCTCIYRRMRRYNQWSDHALDGSVPLDLVPVLHVHPILLYPLSDVYHSFVYFSLLYVLL